MGNVRIVRLSVAEEISKAPLTADMWRRLREKLPGCAHFKIAEAIIVIQKV